MYSYRDRAAFLLIPDEAPPQKPNADLDSTGRSRYYLRSFPCRLGRKLVCSSKNF